MKQKYFFIGLALLALSACGAKAERNMNEYSEADSIAMARRDSLVVPIDTLPSYIDTYTKGDSALVVQILKEYVPQKKTLSHEQLILRVARHFLGVPYVAHTLDRNDEERLVINLHELDCTTYVETVTALVLCIEQGLTRFSDYVHTLEVIRYRGGKMSYTNRLHYFHWWLQDNEQKGLVREINEPDPPFTALQTLKINYMSLNAKAYDMLKGNPERVEEIKALEDKTNGTQVKYIPIGQLRSPLLRNIIHDGDIIAIVTNKRELDTTHLGFAVWHKDGLHLMNASSLRRSGNQVVEPSETFYDYMLSRASNIGIRVARIL